VENIAGKELARGKGGKKGAGADEFALKSFGRWAYNTLNKLKAYPCTIPEYVEFYVRFHRVSCV
jgi:hypothetical protein